MSTLNEYGYAKLNALTEVNGGLDALSFERVDFLKPEQPALLKRVWKTIRTGFTATAAFIKELYREDPASHNERVRRSPYDYIHTRGLY